MANNDGNLPGMSIQLSPDRKPPQATKKKTKKAVDPKTMLIETLLKDPIQKKLILELINDNKKMIEQYQRRDKENASPIDKFKKVVSYESPTALIRRRALEKQKKQKLNFNDDVNDFELENTPPSKSKKPKKTLLIGVRAFVEVMTYNQNKSEGVKLLLQSMGATIADRLSKIVTHVIYKDGSFETFKTAKALNIPLVSVLWLDVINRTGCRVPEKKYPALGMQSSKTDIDAICDKLNSKRRSLSVSTLSNSNQNVSRRKTLLPSHTLQVDDDLLLMDSDNEDIIPGSQPSNPSSKMITTRRNTGRNLSEQDISLLGNNDSSSDDNYDAKSDSPTIDGVPCGKTRYELDVSKKLSESLLQSPYVNTYRKTPRRDVAIDMDIIHEHDDTVQSNENDATNVTKLTSEVPTPPRRLTRKSFALSQTKLSSNQIDSENALVDKRDASKIACDKENQMKTPGQNKSRFSLSKPQELSAKSKRLSVTRTPITTTVQSSDLTPRTRRMTRQTLLVPLSEHGQTQTSMVDMEFTNEIGIGDDNAKTIPIAKRKTNRVTLDMEITSVNDDNALQRVSIDNNNVKNGNSSGIFIENNVPKRKTSATSANKAETSIEDENKNKNITTNTKRTSTSSTRTSTSDNLITYQPRMITRRLSLHLNAQQAKVSFQSGELSSLNVDNSQESTNVMDMKKKISSGTELSLRISDDDGSHSGVMSSLQVSSRNSSSPEGRSSLSSIESNAADADVNVGMNVVVETTSNEDEQENVNVNSKKNIKRKSPVFEREPIESPNVKRSSASPMTKLSDKLESTSISNQSNSTRKKQISQQPKQQTLTSVNQSTTQRINVTVSTGMNSTQSSRGKRKLYHPDEIIEEINIDEDAERRAHALVQQSMINTQDETSNLNRSNVQSAANDAVIATQQVEQMNNCDDDDFVELTQCTTKRTNPHPTQPLTQQQTQKVTQMTQKKVKRKYIVFTRFHSDKMPEVKRIVQQLGGCTIEKCVTTRTTHLVAMECSRTLNMLRAMCRGLWIINSDWLFKSAKAGKWDYEDFYELTAFSPCVQQLRLQRQNFGNVFCHDVFLHCGPIYIAESSHPPKKDLEEFVTLCKGNVVDDASAAKILVAVSTQNIDESQVSVQESWILDCITIGRVKRTRPYLIDPHL